MDDDEDPRMLFLSSSPLRLLLLLPVLENAAVVNVDSFLFVLLLPASGAFCGCVDVVLIRFGGEYMSDDDTAPDCF